MLSRVLYNEDRLNFVEKKSASAHYHSTPPPNQCGITIKTEPGGKLNNRQFLDVWSVILRLCDELLLLYILILGSTDIVVLLLWWKSVQNNSLKMEAVTCKLKI